VSPQAFDRSNKIVFWARCWVAGLALISAVSSYGETGPDRTRLGLPRNAVWTGFMSWLAMCRRLPGERVTEILDTTPHDEEELAAALA